ncbi:MAG: DUF2283 domain-containing protein [Thermoanaerobacteraceae bacterium]|nr:DUF2283 domain-containing protein [Thermoanaerobacteraceae bacterium]
MKIEYDPEVDALYLELREGIPTDSIDLEEGITVDLDDNGHVIGLEVLDASEKLRDGLTNITINGMPSQRLYGHSNRSSRRKPAGKAGLL